MIGLGLADKEKDVVMRVFPDSKTLICPKICAEREGCMKNTRPAQIYARIFVLDSYNPLIAWIIMIYGISTFLCASTVC
jgi:hypothetical protein